MARALIVGAGIAGDALAVQLGRQGWDVTVVEIASALREGGQMVDLRAGSREVLARMGLLDDVLQNLVEQRGMAWVGSDGSALASMSVEAFGGTGFVSTEELLRTDLARVLHHACGDSVDHRFGETVDELEEVEGGVRVRFRSGGIEEFDLVVGADGVHSRVRSLRWGSEEGFRRGLGIAHAGYTLRESDRTPDLDGWFVVHNAPGGLLAEARPGRAGTQGVGLSFRLTEPLPDRHDRAAQIALLERVFGGVGWRAAEIVACAAEADDFALDSFDQIAVPRWHHGRVVLLGDSAWCASPLSGLGTALALLGAEVLAQELGEGSAGVGAAFVAYESRMRPSADAAQKLVPGRVAMYAPMTRLGIRASAVMMRMIQWPVIARLLAAVMTDRGHGSAKTHPATGPAGTTGRR